MITHHPDINMLTEYSSGTLDWALSLGVAAHLHFCPECRNKLATLNSIGGQLMAEAPPAPVAGDMLNKLMAKLEETESQSALLDEGAKTSNSHNPLPEDRFLSDLYPFLPPVVKKLLPEQPNMRWRRVSPSLQMARLLTGQNKYEVAFHRIGRGGKVAQHGHTGLEVTLVLDGSFSDAQGIYKEGDFLCRQPGEIHQPTAAQNQDCLCISICEAPVTLTGWFGRLLNPFLSFKPT